MDMFDYVGMLDLRAEESSMEHYIKLLRFLRFLEKKDKECDKELLKSVQEEIEKRYMVYSTEGWLAFESLVEWVNTLGGSYEMGGYIGESFIQVQIPEDSVQIRRPYKAVGAGYGANPSLGAQPEVQMRHTLSLLEVLERRKRSTILVTVNALLELPRVLPEMKSNGELFSRDWLLEAPMKTEELLEQPLHLCQVIGVHNIFKDGRMQATGVCKLIDYEIVEGEAT